MSLQQDDIKVKIMHEAEALFMKFGFKSITMDDVARELGISKKTLYQYFEDKNDLVNQAVTQYLCDERKQCESVVSTNDDPITYMLKVTDTLSDRRRQINPGVLFDLKKYFKPAWDQINEFTTMYVFENVLQNIELGKSKGYYYKDINEKLIARLYVHLIDFIISPEKNMHENKHFVELHLEVMKYHLRAICTDKGLKILNERLKEIKN